MGENHEPNGGQIYTWSSEDLRFPLRESSFSFAVRGRGGAVSSPWRVKVNDGDVYIVTRDSVEDIKISLHESGRQHIRLRSEIYGRNPMVWEEPALESPVRASVKLLFPVWSLGIGPTKDLDQSKIQRLWNRNDFFVESEDNENFLISVCFVLTPPGVTVQLPSYPPMGTAAILSVGAKKELHMIVRREHRLNMREGIKARLDEMIRNRRFKLSDWQIGKQSCLFISGYDLDGRPYVTRIAVEMKPDRLLEPCRQKRMILPFQHPCTCTSLNSQPR